MKGLYFLLFALLLSTNLLSQDIFSTIQNKNYQRLESLCKKKNQVHKYNSDGISPLWKAALLKDTVAMKILLENGANPNNSKGGKATPIFVPTNNGFLPAAKMLVQYGANVNYQEAKYSLSPLRNASRNGLIDIVKFLVEKGAKIDAVASDKATALTAACAKGHIEIVHYLVSMGADINIIDRDGDTPLNNACAQGRLEVVKYLLKVGVDKSVVNNKGKTAQEIAKDYGFPKIAALLTE